MEMTSAWPWALVIGGALAGAALAGWALQRQRRTLAALRDAREQDRRFAELLDVWQWRTDAQHRLEWLRAPAGSAPTAAAGTLLWERFVPADAAGLRAQLDAGQPLELDVTLGSGRLGRLRARACSGDDGRFAGYLGMVREVESPAPPAPAADAETESFAYSVSHDLRAPIRVVEGFTRILKEDYGRSLDRIGNDHLDRVLGAAARMNSMIDALLALSKLSSQPLSRQPVDLSQLAGYVAEDLRRQTPTRDVALYVEPNLNTVGDPTLLRMVLENLLGNAWKYTGRTPHAEVRFERHAQQPDAYSISDNGAGFDMRFADRLFGVFQRLHSANDFPGTGIGLATVRRIVRKHGGEIWADAEPGRGARFHFTLPR